jgi:hypothetical protein
MIGFYAQLGIMFLICAFDFILTNEIKYITTKQSHLTSITHQRIESTARKIGEIAEQCPAHRRHQVPTVVRIFSRFTEK